MNTQSPPPSSELNARLANSNTSEPLAIDDNISRLYNRLEKLRSKGDILKALEANDTIQPSIAVFRHPKNPVKSPEEQYAFQRKSKLY